MKAIYKYPLPINDAVPIDMPFGAKVLDIQEQHGQVCMWAIIDTDESIYRRWFYVFGTGHQLPEEVDDMVHLASVQQAGGALVWHIFELPVATPD